MNDPSSEAESHWWVSALVLTALFIMVVLFLYQGGF